jgi:thiamine-phosphate pyrophosphorylase
MKTIDRLHYISQPAGDGSHLTSIEKALQAGCKWIQLRIKDQSYQDILECAMVVKELCLSHDAKLIINDYPEIAAEVKTDGLHLGLQDMPINEARKIVGESTIIGGTANTIAHVLQRIQEGADYVGLGPFRFTQTKKHLSPILGANGIDQIMRALEGYSYTIPLIAIGGITPEDLPTLLNTGIYGVAISGAITFATDSQLIVKSIIEQQEKYV